MPGFGTRHYEYLMWHLKKRLSRSSVCSSVFPCGLIKPTQSVNHVLMVLNGVSSLALARPIRHNSLESSAQARDSPYDAPVGSTGFVYVTFSTATFSAPFSSFLSWYTYSVSDMPWT